MSTLQSVQAFADRNGSKILLGLGISGVIAANVLSVKNTPKALQLIERKKEELGVVKLTAVEAVQATWKCYILPASILLSSISCLIGSRVIDARRITDLSAAYLLGEDIFREYKNKVIETIGEEKERDIQNEVDKTIAERVIESNPNIQFASFGDFPCIDRYSKEVFWSTKEKIGAIVNKLNFRMLNENYISVSDYCFEFGIDIDEAFGDRFGWNVNDGYLEPKFSVIELNNEYVHGRPVLMVELNREPSREYDRMW